MRTILDKNFNIMCKIESAQVKWNNSHPEKMAESSRRYRIRHREKLRIAYRKWYEENKEKGIAASTRWSSTNKEKRKLYRIKGRSTSRKYENWLYKNNINFKISKILRARLNDKLRKYINNPNINSFSAVKNLGCTIPELKVWIENKFEEGMTWDNWATDGWHIDHSLPFGAFDITKRENLLKLCNFTNLKPMWAVENIKKGKKLEKANIKKGLLYNFK